MPLICQMTSEDIKHQLIYSGPERAKKKRPAIHLDIWERVIVNQTSTGTVSGATLGALQRDAVERIWAFMSAQILP